MVQSSQNANYPSIKIFPHAVLILGTVLLAGYFLFFNKAYDANYVGYFYPNTTQQNLSIESGPLESLSECIEWINSQVFNYIDKRFDENFFGYECFKNCRLGDDYNQGTDYTCEKSEYERL